MGGLQATRTEGVSPKVRNPALLGLGVALVLYVAGERDTALTVVVAALGYGATGAASKPGRVKVR